MDSIIRLLAALSKATLDPAFGGRGMALSRVLSLAAFGAAKNDESALKDIAGVVDKIEAALRIPRHLTHEEWNELQASAESGHWFLRSTFPQVSATGTVDGGYQHPAAQEPDDGLEEDTDPEMNATPEVKAAIVKAMNDAMPPATATAPAAAVPHA